MLIFCIPFFVRNLELEKMFNNSFNIFENQPYVYKVSKAQKILLVAKILKFGDI